MKKWSANNEKSSLADSAELQRSAPAAKKAGEKATMKGFNWAEAAQVGMVWPWTKRQEEAEDLAIRPQCELHSKNLT